MQLVLNTRDLGLLFQASGSQPEVVFPLRGYLAVSGNIWGCHNLAWALMLCHLVSRTQGCSEHLTVHQPVQQRTVYPNVSSAEVEKLCFIYLNFIFIFLAFFSFIFISRRLITLQYCSGFCHTLTWISHGFTYIPHPDPPSHLPLHPIPLGLPSAPGPSTCLMHPAWAGDLEKLFFKMSAHLKVKYFCWSFWKLATPGLACYSALSQPPQSNFCCTLSSQLLCEIFAFASLRFWVLG